MAQDRYSIFPASLVYAGPTTLNLQQIEGVQLKSGEKKDVIIPGGNVDPAAVMLLGAEPIVTFKSGDLSTLLTAISLTAGLECAAGSNLIQYQARADGGTFQSGAKHVVLTNKKAFVYPKRLTVSQEKPAELELEMMCLYDGSVSGTPALPVPPLAVAVSEALTGTPAFNARYYLGPVYANAVQLPGITDFDIDFGIEVKAKAFDGDLYPQVCSIVARKPKLSFTTNNAGNAGTVGSLFNAALPGTLAFYLRLGAAGDARASDASTVHIKIFAATGAWSVESLDVNGEEDATVKVSADITGTLAAALATAIP